MFYWKNAIVLIAMLAFACLPTLALARSNWERKAITKLAAVAALVACMTVSFLPMTLCQILFGVLLLLCLERRVPMVASYLFFLIWTPAAAGHLVVAGAYFVPLKPVISFSLALLAGYLLNPHMRLHRKFNRSDLYLTAFLLIFSICVSLRDNGTGAARNMVTYALPYLLSYHVLSRTRIERPELVLRILVFAAAAAGFLCTFEMIRVWPIYSGLAPLKGLWVLVDTPEMMLIRGGFFRAFGPFSHPLAGSSVLGMSGVALYCLFRLRGPNPALYLMGAGILLGLFATVSRTGIVALVVGLVTVQLLRRRYGMVMLIMGAGLVVILGLPALSNHDTEVTGAYRLALLLGVPKALGSHLIFGYREATASGLLDAFVQGQGIVDLVNIYLAITVMGGIASLIPYLLFLGSTIGQYRALRRAKPDNDQLLLAQACVGMQAGFMVAGAFMGAWATSMIISMLCIAMIVALRGEVAMAAVGQRKKAAPAIEPILGGETLPAPR
ncbi:MAG: hypothetical protein JF564_02165 [Sphingomonas sp.]|nr:hypothetical protein [Sphingomonas sp.]